MLQNRYVGEVEGMMEIEREADISVEEIIAWLDEAREKIGRGNRLEGENLWMAVCRETLLKIAKLEEKIESLEKKVAELEEKVEELEEDLEG